MRQVEKWRGYIAGLAKKYPLFTLVGDEGPAAISTLFQVGVSDFLTSPLKNLEVIARVRRILGQERVEARVNLPRSIRHDLIGESPRFMEVLARVPIIARCDADVLISGETGTGKELFARAIHLGGSRSGGPLAPVNCGAIPAELVENELFGHWRGASTHAVDNRPGLVREAAGGTLFLDEVDSLPPMAQVKLLRFLQEREYRPLGSARLLKVDLRVMAATNANLESALRENRFRTDLYYRLNVISLYLPPLRERREDIPLLAHHFLQRARRKYRRAV